MPKNTELTITKRSVDGLSTESRDAVFRDMALPGFGVRSHRQESLRRPEPGAGRTQTSDAGPAQRPFHRPGEKEGSGSHRPHQAGRGPASPPPEPPLTVAGLAERHMEAHVPANCNDHRRGIYRGSLDSHIMPALGTMPD